MNTEKTDSFPEMAGSNTKEFITLLSLNQIRIYSYIMSMVGNFNDTDDIMQETTLKMWQKFSEFESGTDFLSWGISIAYYRIKEFRKKKNVPQLSDELVEILHKKAPQKLENTSLYIEKLEDCLKKLNPRDFSLVNYRYMSGYTVAELSKRFNVTIQAIYLKLSKIQGLLTRCIKQSVLVEEKA
jgi:RNA polymerase sigma-70 factor, ECF subfamily